MRPLIAYLVPTLFILLAQTLFDPWYWKREMVTEIPAETYGMCQSSHTMAYFGPLAGLLLLAEGLTLRVAWRTTDLPTDFRDSGAIMYSCWVHIQSMAVGIPMILALGYSSVNATYFARIILTWIFSLSSVTVIVCPKIWCALRTQHQHQETALKTRRATINAVYEPSNHFDNVSLSSEFSGIAWHRGGISRTQQANQFKAIQEAAALVEDDSTNSMTEQKNSSLKESQTAPGPQRTFYDYIHGEQAEL